MQSSHIHTAQFLSRLPSPPHAFFRPAASLVSMEQLGNMLVRSAQLALQSGDPNAVAHEACMAEGMVILRRLCELSETAERRALLGSAYKRAAWCGVCGSRKENLTLASKEYEKSFLLQQRDGSGSSYSKLNMLTLKMLGSDAQPDAMMASAREAYDHAVKEREENPANVWFWVQVADALFLRHLLCDGSVCTEDVVTSYCKELRTGSSDRVKASILDQLDFVLSVLTARAVRSLLSRHEDVCLQHACHFLSTQDEEPEGPMRDLIVEQSTRAKLVRSIMGRPLCSTSRTLQTMRLRSHTLIHAHLSPEPLNPATNNAHVKSSKTCAII